MQLKQLTEEEKKAVTEDYAALGSFRAVAVTRGISAYAVRKAVRSSVPKNDPDNPAKASWIT